MLAAARLCLLWLPVQAAALNAFFAAAGPKTSPKQRLLDLCKNSNYGVEAIDRDRLDELIDELATVNPTPRPAESPKFSGNWKLLWTTESELLFAVEKGLFAAGPCVGVEQTIDVANGRLENVVLFDNDSRLFVGSSIEPDAADASGVRFNFAFSSCSLRWRGYDIPLPPVGRGWGDLLYLDDDLRVQRDVRGDLLIATKR